MAWATAPRRRLRRRSSRSPVAAVAVPSSFKYSSVPECAPSSLRTVIHIVKHDWALNANPSVFRRLILRLTKLDAYPLGRGTQNTLIFNVSQVYFKNKLRFSHARLMHLNFAIVLPFRPKPFRLILPWIPVVERGDPINHILSQT